MLAFIWCTFKIMQDSVEQDTVQIHARHSDLDAPQDHEAQVLRHELLDEQAPHQKDESDVER